MTLFQTVKANVAPFGAFLRPAALDVGLNFAKAGKFFALAEN
jgi:hypothetical protein